MTSPLATTNAFADDTLHDAVLDAEVMTVEGTARAVAVLLGLIITAAAIGWAATDVADPANAAPTPLVCVASVVAFALAILAFVRPQRAVVLAPLYAAVQGLALGAVSRRYDAVTEGIVGQAFAGTVATLAVMALLFRRGLLHPYARFRARALAAGGGLLLFWTMTAVLQIAGVEPTLLRRPGPALAVSLVSVCVAAFFLVLDFETISSGVDARAPRSLEWFAALGLVITLVWIYLELLALMSDGED